MQITREDLDQAGVSAGLSTPQVQLLWSALAARAQTDKVDRAHFAAAQVLYYFGALIVISAMTWFMTLGWEQFGSFGMTAIAVGYGILFWLTGHSMWNRHGLRVPAGLLLTVAVCMTPLAVYGIQDGLGMWQMGDPGHYRSFYEWINGSWFLMEAATIVVGVAMAWRYRFTFLTAPIAFALWFMSMDLVPILYPQDRYWENREWVSMWFGLAMLLVSFLCDRRTKDDFSYWGYFFGVIAFWGGLSLLGDHGEFGKAVYCAINLVLIVSAILLDRRIFLVFGSLGVMGYLGHLAYSVFENSILFPFVLSFIGLGILYHKHRDAIETTLLGLVPQELRRFLPRERAFATGIVTEKVAV